MSLELLSLIQLNRYLFLDDVQDQPKIDFSHSEVMSAYPVCNPSDLEFFPFPVSLPNRHYNLQLPFFLCNAYQQVAFQSTNEAFYSLW